MPGWNMRASTCVRGEELVEALADVDAVLHVAAKTSGDVYAQMEGSVVATENLLLAMADAAVARLILVSSFSVYD